MCPTFQLGGKKKSNVLCPGRSTKGKGEDSGKVPANCDCFKGIETPGGDKITELGDLGNSEGRKDGRREL